MSDCYFEVSNSQTKVTSFSYLPGIEKTGSDCWVPRACVPWDRALSKSVLRFFTKCDYPFRTITKIPFEDPLRSEIRRFFLSLDAYIDSPNPVIPYRDILYGSTKKDYAETLKRIKTKSFQTTWRVQNYEFPDWWNDVPSYQIKDIGDIFNYSYLIFWKEDEPDDYLHGFAPVKISKESITKFKEFLWEILPDRETFQKIEPQEILSQVSSSMSLDNKGNKHIPHYKLKPNNLQFSRKRGVCDRSVIYVSPDNVRDAVINTVPDLNTISLIDAQLLEVLKEIQGHIHLRDKDQVTKRLRHLHKKYEFFIQRDLKKEGITKPRELLTAMMEVLHKEYPDIEVFGYTQFFEDFPIKVNGKILHPQRGHGLGMANALTTLMQITIHNWIVDELVEDLGSLDTECLCLNDDFVVGFNNEYHYDSYWDKEDEVMSQLSLLRQTNKSFLSQDRFVLAERYLTPSGEYEKISYQLRELLLPLSCANISHAKEYFCSAQTYVNSDLVPRYIEDIRAYWGYEFFPDEFSYPTKVGGWINPKLLGVDLTLKMLEELPYNSMIPRAFKAQMEHTYIKGVGKRYNSPWYSLLGGSPNIPDEYLGHLNMLEENIINDKFGKQTKLSPTFYKEYWDKIKEKRKKVFRKPISLSQNKLIEEIYFHYKNIQFYPAEFMIDYFAEFDMVETEIKDIYLDPNPIMSMVSKYNSTSYPFKEDFSIQFTNKDFFSKKVTSIYSKDIERTIKSELISLFFTGRFNHVYIPKNNEKVELQYLEPFRIGWATAKINWGKGYPILKKQYWNPLIEKKFSVYNRIFSLKDIILLSQENFSRERIKLIADFLNENPERELKELLDSLKRRMKEIIPKGKEPMKKTPEVPDNVITMCDLWNKDTQYKFYVWQSDKSAYKPFDEQVDEYLKLLNIIIINLTFEGLRTTEEKQKIRKSIEDGVYDADPLLSKLAVRLGLHTLTGSGLLDNSDSGDDWGGDLFGEDF